MVKKKIPEFRQEYRGFYNYAFCISNLAFISLSPLSLFLL